MATKPDRTPPASQGKLEKALPGTGPLHNLDPRAKLMAAGALSLVTALTVSRPVAWAGLALGLALIVFTGSSMRVALKRLVVVNSFVVFLWIFLPWQIGFDGQGLTWQYHPEGLALAGLITIKANAVFLYVLSLLGTTAASDLLHALDHMRLPNKLVGLFLFFYRYIFVMQQEKERLTTAMKVRGFRARTDWHTWRTYAHLVGMLLVRSYDRAERVYQAMLCRGFNGTIWVINHFRWQRRDSIFCGLMGAAALGLAAAEACFTWN